MPKFDLAGNPLPEPSFSSFSSQDAPGSAAVPSITRYDLAGNPLPAAPVTTLPIAAYSPRLSATLPPTRRAGQPLPRRKAAVKRESGSASALQSSSPS